MNNFDLVHNLANPASVYVPSIITENFPPCKGDSAATTAGIKVWNLNGGHGTHVTLLLYPDINQVPEYTYKPNITFDSSRLRLLATFLNDLAAIVERREQQASEG